MPAGKGEQVQVRYVVDGDTLSLVDGRRVRLIGVNTPEFGRKGQAHQPFALDAKEKLQQWISGAAVRLYEGVDARDRYGRTLAHVIDSEGVLLAETLIASGLGFALGVAPNTALADCLFAVELEARADQRGLWRQSVVPSVGELSDASAGFGLWRGRVSAVGRTGRSKYIELEDRVFLLLESSVLQGLSESKPDRLLGRTVEFRGWLVDRRVAGKPLKSGRRRWFMKVTSRHHIVLVD